MKVQNYTKLFILFFAGLVSTQVFSQSVTNYRRSSLTMVLIENENLGKNKQLVTDSYYAKPFPDKYNNHVISDKVFSTAAMKLTTNDYLNAGFYKDTLKTMKDFLSALKQPLNPLRYVTADSSKAVQEPNPKELLNIYIQKYINEKNLAKQTVATWFDRKPDGTMSWDVIKERGMYSASAEAKDAASSTASAVDYLMDFELIANTYTVFNKLEFFPNEPVARAIRDAAKQEVTAQLAGKPEILLTKAIQGIDAVYEKTKEGYTVICNTYLYQLEWNDSIAKLTNRYFFSDDSNANKQQIWDTTNLYKMKFVGKTTSSSLVTFKIGEKRTEEQIIDLQVKRTIDNALAKLQKEYVQFRPVAPVANIDPVTAQIGLKEGVEAGQKYEILEQGFNELGMPVWKSVGSVSVDKKAPIWDNTIGAEVVLDAAGNPVPTVSATTFSGGKKAQVGLHYLRLIK
jgi:hypothetical protein